MEVSIDNLHKIKSTKYSNSLRTKKVEFGFQASKRGLGLWINLTSIS